MSFLSYQGTQLDAFFIFNHHACIDIQHNDFYPIFGFNMQYGGTTITPIGIVKYKR